MCRVQDALSKYDGSDEASKDPSITPAASAHKAKRLSFAWLDGEVQNVSILPEPYYYIHLISFESVLIPESTRIF